MATVTRYTGKFYKDSTKTFYAVFISASDNPIFNITESTKKYGFTTQTTTMLDGSYKHELSFPKTTSGKDLLLFDIEFRDGSKTQASGEIPTDEQILVAPHDSLIFSTNFDDFDDVTKAYNITDSLYYSKSPYKTLYVFPSSDKKYLDTSSTEDFYYATAGGAAYIASNDLQNAFLTERDYTVKDFGDGQLGRFAAGKGEQQLNFAQYSNKDKKGPKVTGFTSTFSTYVPDEGNTYIVSKGYASSNYYLKGCHELRLPCFDAAGASHSTTCDGSVTLTSAILNNPDNRFIDGKCEASCIGFAVDVKITQQASNASSADGKVQLTMLNGAADYQFVLSAVELGVGMSFSTVNTTQASNVLEVTGMPAGEYLFVATGNSGTCIISQKVFMTSEVNESTLRGCRNSDAINYDSGLGASRGWDELCVFCNSTGMLVTGSDDSKGRTLGPWVDVKLRVKHSSSIATTKASNDDGEVVIDQLQHTQYVLGIYLDPETGKEITTYFNSGDYFTGGTDYEYKLYTLNDPPNEKYYDSAYLAANASLVSTTSNTRGQSKIYNSLAPNHYAVRITYTNDSTTKEYEDCYVIKLFTIELEGCTKHGFDNYSSLATIDDGTCFKQSMLNCDLADLFTLGYGCDTFSGTLEYNYLLLQSPQFPTGGIEMTEAANIYMGSNPLQPGQAHMLATIHLADGVSYTQNIGDWNATSNPIDGSDPLGQFGMFQSDCANPIVKVVIQFTYNGQHTTYPDDGPFDWDNMGDCMYEQEIFVDLTAFNQDCCGINPPEPEIVGCTDPGACNYDPYAVEDDDSCEYESCIEWGCTDPAANNYNFYATDDDGSCEYDIVGCTDPAAENYDPYATVACGDPIIKGSQGDNGCCEYPITDCTTLFDLLGDGSYPAVYDMTYFSANKVNSTTTYNSATEMCESDDNGSIDIVLPSTSILNNTNVTTVYWIAIIRHTSTNTGYASWHDAEIGALTGPDLSGLISVIGEPDHEIAAGDYATLTGSHTFTNLQPGNYNTYIWIFTSDSVSADGLTITYGPCLLYQAGFQIWQGPCTGVPPAEPDPVYGCTDPSAANYNPAATDDDGTCYPPEFLGCTDEYATNYNPAANTDDGSCNYAVAPCSPPTPESCAPNLFSSNAIDAVSSCCIPGDINKRLNSLEECIANSGSRFYNKMITGLSDTCSTMEAWKMVIILEILRAKGLPCVYNCTDDATPNLNNTSCEGVWAAQGSNIWYSANTYNLGSVVKSPVDNKYYVAVTSTGLQFPPNTTASDGDNIISGWRRCCDEVTYSGNINYLTNFLSFAEEYCKDCGIMPYPTHDDEGEDVNPLITIGGINMTNNGASFETGDDGKK